MAERPKIIEDKHLEYLDRLRDSGKTNMFGAAAWLQKDFQEFRHDRKGATDTLVYWMETFSERHK